MARRTFDKNEAAQVMEQENDNTKAVLTTADAIIQKLVKDKDIIMYDDTNHTIPPGADDRQKKAYSQKGINLFKDAIGYFDQMKRHIDPRKFQVILMSFIKRFFSSERQVRDMNNKASGKRNEKMISGLREVDIDKLEVPGHIKQALPGLAGLGTLKENENGILVFSDGQRMNYPGTKLLKKSQLASNNRLLINYLRSYNKKKKLQVTLDKYTRNPDKYFIKYYYKQLTRAAQGHGGIAKGLDDNVTPTQFQQHGNSAIELAKFAQDQGIQRQNAGLQKGIRKLALKKLDDLQNRNGLSKEAWARQTGQAQAPQRQGARGPQAPALGQAGGAPNIVQFPVLRSINNLPNNTITAGQAGNIYRDMKQEYETIFMPKQGSKPAQITTAQFVQGLQDQTAVFIGEMRNDPLIDFLLLKDDQNQNNAVNRFNADRKGYRRIIKEIIMQYFKVTLDNTTALLQLVQNKAFTN